MDIKIITGLSGAGKSTAIKSLEDLGYFSVDNLPPSLMLQFIEMSQHLKQPIDKIAMGIDVRSYAYFDNIESDLKALIQAYPTCHILFFEASDQALIKRFKETRRSHPLNPNGSLIDGINTEREKMTAIKQIAGSVIDTSELTSRELAKTVRSMVLDTDQIKRIAVTFQSFGFKRGLPLDSDLVFDVRFLPNPYYEEALRPLTGNDKVIQDYVFQWHETRLFYQKLRDLLDFLLPQYVREGKTQVTISIGCTGGRHRSVSLCNRLVAEYMQQHYVTSVVHRDLR